MPVSNSDVSRSFNLIADLLELQDANRFRVRSYRDAARTIDSLSTNVRDMVKAGEDLTALDGIGDDLSAKIEEQVETGSIQKLEELKQDIPIGLTDLLRIEGLGPKKVQKLWDSLGITNVEELEQAARDHRIQEISGFGQKTEQNILDHIEDAKHEEVRTSLKEAEEVAEPFREYLADHPSVDRVEIAGSYRRRKETVGDLDFLVISESGDEVSDYFTDYEDVAEVLSHGDTKSSVVLKNDMQVDVRIIPEESYGAALMYFTGSKEHNVALRTIAVEDDLKVNEYGVFDEDGERIAGETEEEIYDLFNCEYIRPELRENRGEVQSAQDGELPELVDTEDIRGDLHSHTTDSDGSNSIQEMVGAARELGYDYFAVTDHTDYVTVTNGHDTESLRDQLNRVDELNKQFDDFTLVKSCEVDITKDGELYLPDEVLIELDMVLVSVHRYFDLDESEQTDRVISALENPLTDVLAHPTARRLPDRDPINLDMDAVMEAALEFDSFLEINAQPDRLDLTDLHAKMAKDKGLKVTISTDAHVDRNLDYMQYGVYQARRGWLEPDDILNTRPWSELQDLFGDN
ncbi:MAG: DNA polymerase/3'-5' exonuclease PolX [bacterium]